jgi:DNA ligase 4
MTFYLDCLESKDDVQRFDVKPCFRVVGAIDRNSISKNDILYLNRYGYFVRVPFVLSLSLVELEIKLDQK